MAVPVKYIIAKLGDHDSDVINSKVNVIINSFAERNMYNQ